MNDLHATNLKQEIERLFLENKYDILQVTFGQKQINGEYINDKCVKFGVKQKLPVETIPADKLIPKNLTIDGVIYKTDIVVVPGKIFAQPNYCWNTGTQSVPPVVSAPVSYNRAKTAILSGGISFSAPPSTGYVNAGTLGGIVIDNFDGKVVGITNSHVGATPGGSIYEAPTPQLIASSTTYGSTASAYKNIKSYQPSSWDRGSANYAPDIIGNLKRAYPMTTTGTNKIDAALINLTDSIIDTTSWYPLCANFYSATPFASTADIDSLTLSNPIFKSSRTTGPVGLAGCELRVTGTSTSLSVDFGTPGAGVLSFINCLTIESPVTNTVVGSGGDSGSLVYGYISTSPSTSAWKVVGLFFAGDSTGGYGFACRIDEVTSLLAVSAYDGINVSATPSLCSYITLPYSTYSNTVSTIVNGKKYWQVGKI